MRRLVPSSLCLAALLLGLGSPLLASVCPACVAGPCDGGRDVRGVAPTPSGHAAQPQPSEAVPHSLPPCHSPPAVEPSEPEPEEALQPGACHDQDCHGRGDMGCCLSAASDVDAGFDGTLTPRAGEHLGRAAAAQTGTQRPAAGAVEPPPPRPRPAIAALFTLHRALLI